MDGDKPDKEEASGRTHESSSDSESEPSSTRSRGRSRVRSRRSLRSSSSPEPQPESHHESTHKSKDRSRGRSRDRHKPGTSRISPRRARSMTRPPSMERVSEFPSEPRSLSVDSCGDRSRDGSMDGSRDGPRDWSWIQQRMSHSPFPTYPHSLLSKQRESPGPRCALGGRCLWTLDKSRGALHCSRCGQTLQIFSSLSRFKRSLKKISEHVSEGLQNGTRTQNSETHTVPLSAQDLHEDDEPRQVENNFHSLFKPPPFYQSSLYPKPVKVTLTRGEAGMGKTVSVQKFTQDWAEGSENQDLDLVLPLSFRELNMVRWGRYSLLELIQELHPSLNELTTKELAQRKVLFIFDGLDESRPPLDFSCEVISEVTQRAEVATLLVNLIKGHLLPNALIWITSRPTAAKQIPVQYVDRLTEISGFASDQHKEQFFKRRFVDEEQCERVLSFIQKCPTLWGMCQSPLFCWTMATVLEQWLQSKKSKPPSLTKLFSHFLLVQMHMKKRKYEHRSDFQLTVAEHELLLKLGRLAFQLLHRGSTHFNQQDLQMEELDPTEALVYSGLCTEVFKQHSLIFNQSPYSFVHPSVQVFLAAVHMHHSSNKPEEEQKRLKLLQDHNTPPLLECFLQELSLKNNHRLLGALLDPTPTDPDNRHSHRLPEGDELQKHTTSLKHHYPLSNQNDCLGPKPHCRRRSLLPDPSASVNSSLALAIRKIRKFRPIIISQHVRLGLISAAALHRLNFNLPFSERGRRGLSVTSGICSAFAGCSLVMAADTKVKEALQSVRARLPNIQKLKLKPWNVKGMLPRVMARFTHSGAFHTSRPNASENQIPIVSKEFTPPT